MDRAAAYAAEDLEWVTVATGETFRGPEGYKRYMQGCSHFDLAGITIQLGLMPAPEGAEA